jgi:hypothetical protein
MEDFSALAARVAASVGELRGCLILSRDGLVLGAYPGGDEALVKPAWLRFATLGEPEKGFVQFGDEVWSFVRRGAYAAFAVSGATIRPGLVIDQLELVLLMAEEIRSKREPLKVPEAPAAPQSKPRTPLHPEAKPAAAAPAAKPARAQEAPVAAAAPAPAEAPAPPAPAPAAAPAPAEAPAPPAPAPAPAAETEEGEVDRVLLAQEFSRLLQERAEGDET